MNTNNSRLPASPVAEGESQKLVEKIARYIESESECLMEIVVDETKHDYGVRLLKVMANEIREKFECGIK